MDKFLNIDKGGIELYRW